MLAGASDCVRMKFDLPQMGSCAGPATKEVQLLRRASRRPTANFTIGFMNVTSRPLHTLAANRTFVRRARGCVQHNYFEATVCDGAALLIGFATTSVLFASSAGTFAPG